jgi:opacity protein-like surface antigen
MMKRFAVLAALALALLGAVAPADAASVVLCAARQETNVAGGQVQVPGLSKIYASDNQGCTVAQSLADIAILRANGWGESGKCDRSCSRQAF